MPQRAPKLPLVSNQRVKCGILHTMSAIPFDFAVENYPLAPSTLYRVGGPAKLALLPCSGEDVVRAYEWMATRDGPKLVLGGGSNVLIADEGFPGIVLFSTHLDRLEALGNERYRVEGGVALDTLVRDVIVANNYEGAGALTGIPGSVGGAVFMNAGTVKGSICELIHSVDLASEKGLSTLDMNPSLYDYRSQFFCPPGALIYSVLFQFTKAEEDQRAIYERYMARRREKQPQGHSCGSVFKNPKGDHAGRLIEACGLKGTRRGDAVISSLHANFILNEGHARFEDILWLIQLAKENVHERFGVELEEEVKIYG